MSTADIGTGITEEPPGSGFPAVFNRRSVGEDAEDTSYSAAGEEAHGLHCQTEEHVAGKRETSCLDVAEYILRQLGPMSTMKLQKLVYYCQAWSLVWDDMPLFREPIEAWANGPVVRALFDYHRGMFHIGHVLTGNPDLLSSDQRDTIDAVVRFYGGRSAQWLIDLSHQEEPWIAARRGLGPTERGSRVIDLSTMAQYYSSL